jgi:uncharacterized membrane protein
MGRYICSKREKNNGLIIGSTLIIAGVVVTTVSSILLLKNNNESDKSPDAPVANNPYGGLIFSGSLITYAGLVLVPLYATSKRE